MTASATGDGFRPPLIAFQRRKGEPPLWLRPWAPGELEWLRKRREAHEKGAKRLPRPQDSL